MIELLNALPGAVAQGLIWGIMAIGLYITYKILDFADLTVDGSITTGACVCALLLNNGVNVWVCLLAAFLSGAIAGLITGILHTLMGIPPILSGILTQLMLWSINLKILGKSNMAVSGRLLPVLITSLDNLMAIVVVSLFVVGLIALLYFFFGTELGCTLRATGNNEQMVKAQGVNVKANKLLGLMLSNALVALAGALLAQYQGFADINMGRGAIVIGLAAIIIGQTLVGFIGRNFALKLFGCALGGVCYYIVYQFVVWLGLDTDLLKLLSAMVVAVFLAIPYIKKEYFSRPKKKSSVTQPSEQGGEKNA
jgi:putative ABC transport system permease protein